MLTLLKTMLAHMTWADDRVIRLLLGAADPPTSTLRLIAHLVAAERVWLLRLRGEDSSTQQIWPEWPIEQVATVARENAAGYREFIDGLSDDDVARVVDYRNSQGQPFRTAIGDILTHVMLHGSYHRGQIATTLRAADVAPQSTDFIVFVRERAGE